MPQVTISGLEHEWDALNHLQSWVSKNVKSYFGKEIYRRAKGCVRDKTVKLGSVQLGSIEGTVLDGSDAFRTVYLNRLPGILSASCDCDDDVLIKAEVEDQAVVKKEEIIGDTPNMPCHHLAAFLIYVSDAKPKETAVFICGEPNNNFDLRGYVAAFNSREELVEKCSKDVSTRRHMVAKFTLGAICDGRSQVVAATHADFENIIISFQGGQGGNPRDLSDELKRPFRKLFPLFNTQPNEVMMILKRVITLLGKVDLNVYQREVDEQPEEFDSTTLGEICVGFVLSKLEGSRGEALKELVSHLKSECLHVNWSSTLIQKCDREIGPELSKLLTSLHFLRHVGDTDNLSKLLTRFPKEHSVELKIIELELAISTTPPAPAPTSFENQKEVLELINLYISTGQPQKAIDWIDSRLGWGRVFETSLETSHAMSTRYQRTFPMSLTHPNTPIRLMLIRAKLAADVEKDADIQLSWLKKAIRKCSSESVFKDCCELRPDRILDLEAQYFDSHPDAFLLMLDKAGRHGDISALLSTKENLDRFKGVRVARKHFNIHEYFTVHGRVIVGVDGLLACKMAAVSNLH